MHATRETYWLYHNGKPIHAVRLEAGASDREVRTNALRDLEVCPGVVCEYPLETPSEKEYQIWNSEVRQFPTRKSDA